MLYFISLAICKLLGVEIKVPFIEMSTNGRHMRIFSTVYAIQMPDKKCMPGASLVLDGRCRATSYSSL
jgi:hypothetical protein